MWASKPQSALTHTDRQHKNKLVKKGTHKEALTHTVTVEEFIFDSMQQVTALQVVHGRWTQTQTTGADLVQSSVISLLKTKHGA